ncbi:MAG: DUF1848 domain-containing protein [Planctomycetes bacterium]|nr:DUF1848 domain-containing protein [Planctomycetota bacterium]
MIISASYKTDIPTFYGEWFMNRLRAGYCKMVNPYNRRVIRVSLQPETVEGIVFWTKNVGPFVKHLPEVKRQGFPFVIQHTINGYPRALEQAVVDAPRAVEHLRSIADRFGPRVCVWRYDTIINSSLTPRDYHIETLSRLAKALQGATDEVVISFAYLYRKTLRNMEQASKKLGFTWSDPSDDWKRSLTTELASTAAAHGIRLTICSQPQFIVPGSFPAHCVDAERLADLIGKPVKACLKGNRKECGCYESRDIGEYDTCPHGCLYCYAVQNQELAKSRYKQHDPMGESLLPLPADAIAPKEDDDQLSLFGPPENR